VNPLVLFLLCIGGGRKGKNFSFWKKRGGRRDVKEEKPCPSAGAHVDPLVLLLLCTLGVPGRERKEGGGG